VTSLLQQLQGDDTLLLMYLVGELPAADQAEVERRVAADPKVRADLDRLTETYGSFTSGMEALDAASPVHADVSAAVRRASTAIRQWQARPAPATVPGVERRPTSRWRVWAIPSAAAAIVLVVVGMSLYSNPTPRSPFVRLPSFPSSRPVVPPVVNPPPEEVATVFALTTGSTEVDPFTEVTGPSSDSDSTRDDSDSKALREDGAVFNVPLP
jgi:hypothetical protein